MSDILIRIKRAVLAGNYAFSEKARIEMEADSLTELDVARVDLGISGRLESAPLYQHPAKAFRRASLCDSKHEPQWTSDLYEG